MISSLGGNSLVNLVFKTGTMPLGLSLHYPIIYWCGIAPNRYIQVCALISTQYWVMM